MFFFFNEVGTIKKHLYPPTKYLHFILRFLRRVIVQPRLVLRTNPGTLPDSILWGYVLSKPLSMS